MLNRHIVFVLFGFLQAGAGFAQNNDAGVKESNFSSAVLGKDVTLQVHLPDSYSASGKPYPVLYLIHGSRQTVEEVGSIAQKMHQEQNIPELIVVGVDLSDDRPDRMTDPAVYDRFLSCMEQELIPAIGKQYRAAKRRLLYERSLSGSLTLYAFLTKPALFSGYIAASKQWYDENNDYFSGLARRALQKPKIFKGKKIFLATLNGAYNNNNIPEVDRQMQAFARSLRSRSGNRISAEYRAFDDWGITPQPGFAEGLLFVFSKGKTDKPKPDPLTMEQTDNGRWVIMDGKKTILYDVFPYDNGPDYPSEGLIRVVKNGKIGYADAATYAIVIEPRFDCAYPFEKGKAKVSNRCRTVKEGEYNLWESDAWQYVDKKGQFKN